MSQVIMRMTSTVRGTECNISCSYRGGEVPEMILDLADAEKKAAQGGLKTLQIIVDRFLWEWFR